VFRGCGGRNRRQDCGQRQWGDHPYSDIRNRIQSIEKIAQDNPKVGIEGVSEREVLQQLIWEKLAAAEIKRLKISVTEGEVDSAIQSIKEENHLTDAQFEQALLRQGQTLKSVRDSIRKQIEQNRLMDRVLKSKIVITDEQVNAYMKTLKAPQASTRQSMRIAVIFLPAGRDGKDIQAVQKQAGEIHSRLKSGADFGRMAREYSKGPGAQDGGILVSSNWRTWPLPLPPRSRGSRRTKSANR